VPSWSVENSAVIDADGFEIFVRENREGGMKEGTELFCMRLFCEDFYLRYLVISARKSILKTINHRPLIFESQRYSKKTIFFCC
jgi:hypothetical protein